MDNSKKLQRLCFNAVLIALVVVFDLLSIKFGNIKITFGGLPIILCAMLYGPIDGMIVGLAGSLIGQLFSYGLGVTTVLWILPAGIRGLLMGVMYILSKRSNKVHVLSIEILISSLVVTVVNTVVMYLDAMILGYPLQVALVENVFRFISSIVTAFVYSALVVVLIRVLDKYANKN